jgi:hypothetical protein
MCDFGGDSHWALAEGQRAGEAVTRPDARGLGIDRGKTVTKPIMLRTLGKASSEKQIPQVVENLGSGEKSREALETVALRVKNRVSFQSVYLLLRFSTTWGVCFRSADILQGLNTASNDTVLIRHRRLDVLRSVEKPPCVNKGIRSVAGRSGLSTFPRPRSSPSRRRSIATQSALSGAAPMNALEPEYPDTARASDVSI